MFDWRSHRRQLRAIALFFVFLFFVGFAESSSAAPILQESDSATIVVSVIRPDLEQCQNGIDDDLDGQIDFHADRGCESETDNDESDDPPLPEEESSSPAGSVRYSGPSLSSFFRLPLLARPEPLFSPRFDFNGDRKIDIADLSILLFYFDKSEELFEDFDFNSDRAVDIVDVSIFMYYWTDAEFSQ